MAHHFSRDAVKQAAQEGGFAAARREERKQVKYDRQHLPGTSSALTFTPLDLEHFGRWGTAAKEYWNTLARTSLDLEGQRNEVDF